MSKPKKHILEIDWLTIPVKYIKLILLIILILLSVAIYYIYFKAPKQEATEVTQVIEETAKFIFIIGDVQVKKANLYVWKPADYRVSLNEGDLIRTAPNSHAKIEFNDKTIVDISSDSMVRVEKIINDQKGGSISNPNFEVGEFKIIVPEEKKNDSLFRTGPLEGIVRPASEAVVRSNPEENIRSVEMHRGEAELKAGNEKLNLNTLEGVKLANNQFTEKVKLPPPPVLKLPKNNSIHEFIRPDYLELPLEWYDIESAKSYRLYISAANSPYLSEKPLKELEDNKIILRIKISPKAKHLWAVSAVDKNNVEGPQSSIWSFTVQRSLTLMQEDKTPPILKITEVEPFIPFLNIKGITEPNASLTINGETVDVSPDGKFDYFYRLKNAGINEIFVIAEDAAGNKTEKKIVRDIK